MLRRKLWRDVGARRGRFAAIVVTVILGVALYAASFDAFLNLEASYEELYTELHFADVTLVGPAANDAEDTVRQLEGVAAVEVRTVAETPLRIGGSHELIGRVVSVPGQRSPQVNDVLALAGTESPGGGVLVEQHMADHFDIVVGDQVEALTTNGWEPLDVSGVVASPEYLWPARSRQEVLTSPDDFGVLFATAGTVGRLEPTSVRIEAAVSFAPEADAAAVMARVEETAATAGVSSWYSRDEQPSQAALQEDVSGFGEMSYLFPVMFLGAAGLAAAILLTRLVLEQRSVIGLLRANGFRRRTIFGHYLSYGVLTGLAGAVPGAVIGVLLARAITGLYTDAIAVPLTVIAFRPTTLIAGTMFGVVAGALSALGPAMRAARSDPAAAMRSSTPSSTGRRSLVERSLPVLRRLSASGKLVLRSLQRRPGRSAATGFGVILAAVLIISTWGLIDTMQILLSRQFNEVQRQDGQAVIAEAGVLADIASLPGVDAVEPALQLPATLATDGPGYDSVLTAFVPDTAMHTFRLTDETVTKPPADGLYVGSALREVLGLEVGDQLTVSIDDTMWTASIRGFVKEPLGTVAYASLEGLPATAGEVTPNSALLAFAPGVDRTEMRSQVTALDGVTGYYDSRALFDTANSYMGLFYVFVGVMAAFGAMMAFALIYNGVSANVSERAGEFGTLKAAGVSRRTIARLVTAENLILIGVSLVPGLIAGHFAASAIMTSFNSDLFRFDVAIRPTTYLLTALIIAIAGLLSQRPVVRRLAELDVATVVRERSL